MTTHRGRVITVALVGVVVATSLVAYLAFLRHGGGPVIQSRSGDLMDLVGSLVDDMPGGTSDAYVAPTSAQEQQMSSAFRLVEQGDLTGAAEVAEPLDYQVVRYTDTASRREFVLLQERRRSDGSWPHAWGLYAFSPSSSSHLVVEVAHPVDDIDSWVVGVDTFRMADAVDLFVFGASRYAGTGGSAASTHNPDTVFQAIHQAAVSRPGDVVFQPHGFELKGVETHGDLVGTDVIASNGTGEPDDLVRSVAAGLRAAGFVVCLYEGGNCGGLGGTTNVQGQTILVGERFLHVEMALAVRRSPDAAAKIAAVIARATASSPSG